MKLLMRVIVVAASFGCVIANAQTASIAENPAIDMPGFLRVSLEAAPPARAGECPKRTSSA